MPKRDIIVMGASAGGVKAYFDFFCAVPKDLPAAFFIVLHTPARKSLLPELISSKCGVAASFGRDGERFEYGRIYVAPPDFHMLLKPGGRIRLIRGPKENFSRPAIDPLFRSAADSYGERVAGILLSGGLSDGSLGLRHIKEKGGLAIVQDLNEAEYTEMPRNGIRAVRVDFVLPISEIAARLSELAKEDKKTRDAEKSRTEGGEKDMLEYSGEELKDKLVSEGELTRLTCPECGGVFLKIGDGKAVHFRCQVGHAYSLVNADQASAEAVEGALWNAMRILEERRELLLEMKKNMKDLNDEEEAAVYAASAKKAKEQAALIRGILEKDGVP